MKHRPFFVRPSSGLGVAAVSLALVLAARPAGADMGPNCDCTVGGRAPTSQGILAALMASVGFVALFVERRRRTRESPARPCGKT